MTSDRPGWRTPPSLMTLGASQVDVWRASLAQPADTRHALERLLSADERERVERFRRERDRHRFAVAHGVLRVLLADYLGVPPADLPFVTGAHGKPRVADSVGDRGLRFNLAHSGDAAVFAFARDRDVGVDLEEIDARAIDPALAERFFAAGERRTILVRPLAERGLTFARLWTLKEAYLKAAGLGLSQPLDTFEVRLDEAAPQLVAPAGVRDAERAWRLVELDVGPRLVGALCVQGHAWELSCWDWEPRPFEAAANSPAVHVGRPSARARRRA